MKRVSKFLADKFMPKMHLRQPRFISSACEPFTKNKERIWKFKEIHSRHICKSKLDDCFQHNMVYEDFSLE